MVINFGKQIQLCQAVTVTIKQTNLFQIVCSVHQIRKNYETLHLCEEILKLKYSLVCYALLTSSRTFNGGVVRRVYYGELKPNFIFTQR